MAENNINTALNSTLTPQLEKVIAQQQDQAIKFFMEDKIKQLDDLINLYTAAWVNSDGQQGLSVNQARKNHYDVTEDLLEQAALDGYRLIQSLREFFTGQIIEYLYAVTNNGSVEGFKAFTLNELPKVTSYKYRNIKIDNNEDKVITEINLLEGKIKQLTGVQLQQQTNDFIQFLNNHTNLLNNIIENDFDSINGFLQVKKSIFDKYSNYNSYKGKKNRYRFADEDFNNRRNFKTGHVVEAYVAAQRKKLSKSLKIIQNRIFKWYLNFDSISATKGPDVALAELYYSVKQGAARLMRISSIRNDCIKLKAALQSAVNTTDIKRQAKALAAVFTPDDESKASLSHINIANSIAKKLEEYGESFKNSLKSF